ncbi:MAG: hypothetical protein CL955_01115 [Erythrobacteraceae bacterium]|nr:hypothetical protein [Erythrobacteraceae bacterium]
MWFRGVVLFSTKIEVSTKEGGLLRIGRIAPALLGQKRLDFALAKHAGRDSAFPTLLIQSQELIESGWIVEMKCFDRFAQMLDKR